MDTASESWLPVPGYEGHYEVSDLGRVKSHKRSSPRILKPGISTGGYPLVTLCLNGRATWLVHRLVMRAFVGAQPQGMETRHLDGNPTNNALSNLAYGSGSENQQDRLRHGTNHWALKTHCPRGHPYDQENTILDRGRRRCRECKRASDHASYLAHAESRYAKNRAWKAAHLESARAYHRGYMRERRLSSKLEEASSKT